MRSRKQNALQNMDLEKRKERAPGRGLSVPGQPALWSAGRMRRKAGNALWSAGITLWSACSALWSDICALHIAGYRRGQNLLDCGGAQSEMELLINLAQNRSMSFT